MELNITTNVDAQPGKAPSKEKKGSVASRYEQLKTNRNPYEDRAIDSAKVTIPSLFTNEVHGDQGRLKTPYQSTGARGLLHLANKLGLSLFPPNTPFFKLEIDNLALNVEEAGPEIKTELDTALVKVEQAVMTMLETMSARASLHEAFKQLLVSGNVLLYVNPEGIRVIHLQNYCVQRDPMGKITEIIVEEEVYPEALPEGFLADKLEDDKTTGPVKKTVKVYTCVKFDKGVATWYQEAKGEEVPNTYGMCPEGCSPWICLRFNRLSDEEYGRSFIEQFYGDLLSLEALYQSVLEGSAAAAKILFLVNPNGTTRPRTIANAANGSIIQGNAADVSVIQSQKAQDLGIAQQTIERIEGRLQFAFLLNTAIQRPGERVTAEEIRVIQQSIERQLGGIYSLLSQEFQLPLITRLMARMEKQKRLPKLPKKFITPTIITGVEALGRASDLNKLDFFLQGIAQTLGPEVLGQYVNLQEYIKRRSTALSLDTEGLIKTPEQIAEEQQAMQQQMVAQQVGPQMLDIADKQFREAQKIDAEMSKGE